jgi:hypothetical protein
MSDKVITDSTPLSMEEVADMLRRATKAVMTLNP